MIGRISTLGGVLLLTLLTACASPIRQQLWHEVSSERFRIVSNLDLEEAKRVVVDLERFHGLIKQTTNVGDYESPIPNDILAFASERQLQSYLGSRNFVGMFIPGLRSNMMLLAPSGRRVSATQTMLHEYVHFVVANGEESIVPLWYSEGFAELLSSARVDSEKMVVGGVPGTRAGWIQYGNWLDADDVIRGEGYDDFSGDRLAQFYAQAWLLVHYLTLDRNSDQKMSVGLSRYLGLLRQGAEPIDAFERGFGEDVGTLNKRLRDLVNKRNGLSLQLVGLPVDRLEYDRSPPSVRVIPADEVAVWLGGVCLRRGDLECVRREARFAVEQQPKNGAAHALLGDGLKFDSEWDAAEPEFRRALELAPESVTIRLDWGEYLADRAKNTPDPIRRRQLLKDAREVFRDILADQERNPEAWLVLASSYLVPGEDPSLALKPTERAFDLLPSSQAVKSVRAEVLLMNGRRLEAEKALHEWLGLRHGNVAENDVEAMMDEMLQRRSELAEKLGVALPPDA